MRRQLGLGAFSVLAAMLFVACGGGGGGGGGSSSSLSFPYSQYLQVSVSEPEPNSVQISRDALPQIVFDRAVDVDTLDGNFRLEKGGVAVSGTLLVTAGDTTVQFVPDSPLDADSVYQIHVTPSVHSSAGVPLYIESLTPFQTTPAFSGRFFPYTGASNFATNASFAVLFTQPVDPATVTSSTFYVQKSGVPVSGTISLDLDDRVALFHPDVSLTASSTYVVSIVGGSGGILDSTGDELASSSSAVVTTNSGADISSPTVKATVHEIPASMNSDLTIPTYGSRIDLSFNDGLFGFINPGSCRLTANVAIGSIPAGENLLTSLPLVTSDYSKFRVFIPSSYALAPGSVVFTAEASDLAGNAATPGSLACDVATATNTLKPFEHVQLCWARFDMNRDSHPGNDFTEDLVTYGLIAAGDPLGKNAQIETEIREAIVGWSNTLFQTSSWGRVLVTSSQPDSALYMKIAVGGFDPGAPDEDLDGQTTGVLGRAYFDDRNLNYIDNDTVTSPALGVFPREMYRAYTTAYPDNLFNSSFIPLAPDLGGTPFGAAAEDAAILAPGFDYTSASSPVKSRYNTVYAAITRFEKVVGFLLAHETAHSCGLVPDSLNGLGYHDKNGSSNEVMIAQVSFSLIAQSEIKFRTLDLTYLLQVILRM